MSDPTEPAEHFELSQTQEHFLRQTARMGSTSSIPKPTAAVLLRLGLVEDARRFGSDGMQVGGFVLTDAGTEWLAAALPTEAAAPMQGLAEWLRTQAKNTYWRGEQSAEALILANTLLRWASEVESALSPAAPQGQQVEGLSEFELRLTDYAVACHHGQSEKIKALNEVLVSMFRSRPAAQQAPVEPTNTEIEAILDDADYWERDVIEDRAAVRLRKHLEQGIERRASQRQQAPL